MEEAVVCPQCNAHVRSTDFYCFQCGKNLRPKLSSTSFSGQALLYLGSVFLPPMGIIWGVRRLKEEGRTRKIIGMIAILLTVASLVYSMMVIVDAMNSFNTQFNQQMQGLQGF